MNFSALCTLLVAFSPVTPEFTLLTIHLLRRYAKNRYIVPNISEYTGLVVTYFTGW